MTTPLIRQAIRTRFLPPTNFRGPRIVAHCQAIKITLSYNHELNPESNSAAACQELRTRMAKKNGSKTLKDCPSWGGKWAGGAMPDGSIVWVKQP